MEPGFLLVGLQPSASGQVPRSIYRARALNAQSSAGGWGAQGGLPLRTQRPGPSVEGCPQQVSLKKPQARGAAVSSGHRFISHNGPRRLLNPLEGRVTFLH